jgi:hypothetical protein
MFMTCSSKVILFATSEGSPTTSGPINVSLDRIWRGNQGKSHMKEHIDVVP